MLGICARLAAAVLLACLVPAPLCAQEVIPDFYREPGLSPNKNYVNQNASEHIDPQNGGLQHHYVDLHLPGNGGFDVQVVRSYNATSVDPLNPAGYSSLMGVGWTLHFGRVLKTRNSSICSNVNALSVIDNPVIEMNDGSRQLLTFPGSGVPLAITAQRWKAECLGGGAGLAVYAPDGRRYDMLQQVNVGTAVNPVWAWYATRITDRNGNWVDISYSGTASDEITGLSTSDGRTVSFTYLGGGTTARRITAISAAGRTYSYSYQPVAGTTDRYLLTGVARPDGTSWGYEYNGSVEPQAGSYLMRRWIYPQGGSVSYSYAYVYFDSQANPGSRTPVVSAKSQSTGGSWTFSYTPGAPGVLDTTVVNTPSGTITYRHVGPNYVSSGTVWMVGLLMSRQLGSTQTETYSWGPQALSNENYLRPGAFVLKVDAGATNAPILLQRQIVRNGASYTTSYSNHDSYGNPQLVSESGPGGGSRSTTRSYYVNTALWIVNQAQNESYAGSSTTRSFDTRGNLLSVTRDGVTTQHTYTAQGDVATTTFPRGLVHTYGSYFRGIAQTEAQPEAVTILRTVESAGNVTAETNGDGFTTRYTYDGLNRLTSITYPVGNPVSIAYTATTKTATRGALVETTTYDGLGRIGSVTLGGVQRVYTNDALGRIVFESNPGAPAVGTSYAYDILGRRTQLTNADATTEVTTWGAATRAVRDERGNTTTHAYRAYGDPDRAFLMSVSSPVPSLNVSITRNARDLVATLQQGSLLRSYGYNANYYLSSVTNPENGTTSYGRDAAGNMTSRTVGSAGTTTYRYDGLNRVAGALYPGAPSELTHTYNKRGRILTASGWGGARSYAYDANGNLTSETLAIDGGSATVGFGYNANDQLASITYPVSGRVVGYAPDVLGRPTQASGFVNSVSYWPSGQVSSIGYANGVITSYGQNNRLWPSSFTVSRAGAGTFANSAYGYDGAGNLLSITDSVDGSYNRSFGYDAANRVVTANGPFGAGSYAYGAAGNITSQVVGPYSLNYAYDGANRLSAVSGFRSASYGYDAHGNVVSAGTQSFQYDGVPQLACANCGDATRSDYTYDGSGARSSATRAGVRTYEFHDRRGNLLLEFTPAQANRTVEHIYLGARRVAQVVSP